MLRKFVLPLAAAALMAGCMTTAPYGYRGGQSGDYYYGSPSVEYRHHGAYGYPGHGYPGYGYPGYGHPYYGPYRRGFYGSFNYGHPYGYGYYGRPYYGYPHGYPYQRPIYRPRPDPTTGVQPDTRPDGGGWRNFDELRRRQNGGGATAMTPPTTPAFPTREPRPTTPREDGGSRMSRMIERASEARRAPRSEEE